MDKKRGRLCDIYVPYRTGKVEFVCEGLGIRRVFRIMSVYPHYRGDVSVLCDKVLHRLRPKYQFDEGNETIQGHYWHLIIHLGNEKGLSKLSVYDKGET